MSLRRTYVGFVILGLILVGVPLLSLRDSNATVCRWTGGTLTRHGFIVEMGHTSLPPRGSGITTSGPSVEGYNWYIPTTSCK